MTRVPGIRPSAWKSSVRTLLSLSTLSILLAVPVLGQTTPAAGPPTRPVKPGVTYKKVARPPASIAAPHQARLSTAARVASLANTPPLQQLPAFMVADRDGKPLAAATVPHATHWFLLVRQEDCLPCDRLMNGLSTASTPEMTAGVPYVIVVAGKTQDSVERVRGAFPALSGATWLVDTANQAIPALKARGTPMLYALEGSRIVWSVPGTLAQPGLVEKMAASWMTAKPLQTSTPTASTSQAAPTPATK